MGTLNFQNIQVGVLGGGQLGRMLLQAGLDFNISFKVLDPSPDAPCANMGPFSVGSLTDFDTVMEFGKSCDLLTIEIENVNTQALKELVKQGKQVYPQPEIIEMIQDKRKQKSFYKTHNLPCSDFILVDGKKDVLQNKTFLPAVFKLGKEGYDGRGVQVLRSEEALEHVFDAPGVLEKLIDIDKEISILVARNVSGDIVSYPPVEMVFHADQNLVEYLFAPAEIPMAITKEATMLARKIIGDLKMVGVLAVEFFVTKEGKILINEIAPRPHNSGHHTIEANVTSQYEQHLRSILNFPLGRTDSTMASAMVNLLGEPGYNGIALYRGMEAILKISGVHVHLYGKKDTKPYRKMGHVTILDSKPDSLKEKVALVKGTLKVICQ